ncbi:MAG: 7,8-didemethyl-8-hydroxy-5-deazariboflavin synthase subunit CofG, partial [Candidatus Hydrothermarchaeaceae archaeon]
MITYAKNVFIPLSNACRNSCGYCGFRSSSPYILRREDVEEIIKKGRAYGCKEALFTLGERPESNAGIRETLSKWGY